MTYTSPTHHDYPRHDFFFFGVASFRVSIVTTRNGWDRSKYEYNTEWDQYKFAIDTKNGGMYGSSYYRHLKGCDDMIMSLSTPQKGGTDMKIDTFDTKFWWDR